MGKTPRHAKHNLTRITISGGKHTQPRLMMAHPMGERDLRLPAVLAVAVIVIVVLLVIGATR